MNPVYDKLAGEPCNTVHYMIVLVDNASHLAWEEMEERVFFHMIFNFTEEKLLSEPHL